MIVKFKKLTKDEARVALEEWRATKTFTSLSGDYQNVRSEILEVYKGVSADIKKSDYKFDIHFGSRLYNYFIKKDWFSVRLASDDGFWRYLSVVIIPDIVKIRWKENMDDHCWKKPERIWLKNIWWYIFISMKEGSVADTLTMLEKPVFNTDVIMNVVERTGRKGFYLDVTRQLMYYYSLVTPQHRLAYDKVKKYDSDTLFRALMRLNTVRLPVIDPMLVEGGAEGYVKSLFKDFNIEFE